jgi:acetylornithine/N-succinyldiaminopimelate aminotransferase
MARSPAVERFGGAQAFFCNSGAETIGRVEAVRKATGAGRRRSTVPSTAAPRSLSVTGQPAKRTRSAARRASSSLDDVALEAAVGPDTGCILIEPVQGEGGIHPASQEFLSAARELADATGALLVFDEVQTGVGRTGSFFCFERYGVTPDAATLAKGLANGLPIGALLAADAVAGAFEPGDHASTFGGNPVTCAAACATVDAITDDLLANVAARERQMRETFPATRGAGLLLALDVEGPVAGIVAACAEHGVLVGTAGPETLRITPPLTIAADEFAHGLAVLEEVLAQ